MRHALSARPPACPAGDTRDATLRPCWVQPLGCCLLWGTILAANDITLTSLFCWNIPVFNQGLCGVDIARHTKKQPFWWINIIYSWVGFENMVRKSKVVLQKSMTPISCSHSLFAINQYKSYGPLRTPTESGKRHRQNDLGRIRSHLKRLMANSSHQMIIIHGHPWPTWIRSGHFFLRSQKKSCQNQGAEVLWYHP